MGGFFLKLKDRNLNEPAAPAQQDSLQDIVDLFAQKGMTVTQTINTDHFFLYLFHRDAAYQDNIYIYENGDFVVGLGTPLYNSTAGQTALKRLFEDFKHGRAIHEKLNGSYTCILYHKGNLFIFNDYVGLYRVYVDQAQRLLSSSFLALHKQLETKTPAAQEIYEYIFDGAFFGRHTIYKEVKLLSPKHVLQILPQPQEHLKTITFDPLPDMSNRQKVIDTVLEEHLAYFKALADAFQSSFSTALSGGFDSRLMLALMRHLGISPYLYVYGTPNDADVRIAKMICERENLSLAHENPRNHPQSTPEQFPAVLARNFFHLDGFSNNGVFNNGFNVDTRLKRTGQAAVQLNGSGGDLYRGIWNLPDKKLSLQHLLDLKYNYIDQSICTDQFNKNAHFSTMAQKMRATLEIETDILSHQQVQMLYPFWRMRYWTSMTQSTNHQYAHAVMPYVEPQSLFYQFHIPLKYKYYGQIEADMIKQVDERLARYPSTYGVKFYTSPRGRVTEFLKLNTPISLRLASRRYRKETPVSLPYFLSPAYLSRIFSNSTFLMDQFINVKAITDREVLSRVLSLELLLQDSFLKP